MDNAVPRLQLKRVNPFMGLMIDAQTWGDSHDYHRIAEQAHALALHGWGIVGGLEVDPTEPADRAVWIRPGVAIDSDGRLIMVAQPFRYQITTQEEGVIYLVLMFREIPMAPALSIEDGAEHPSRLLEAYAIYERDRLPDQAHVELGRVLLSSGKKPLRAAADPTAPKPDEIDLRFREYAGIRPGPRATVGVWKPANVADALGHHLAGPTRLYSALSSGLDWRLRRRDQPQGEKDPIDCDLLVVPVTSKTTFNEAERNQLSTFLDEGGVLLAEACSNDKGADAQKAMASLAQALGRKPEPVGRDHPLLTVRHIFSSPPPGAASGQVLEAGGLILSTADYACAWNGGPVDKGLDRSAIRSTVEFAENMLAYALVRRGNARRAARADKKG